MAKIIRVNVKEVTKHFEQLQHPSSLVSRRHPLISVVVISILAVLSGANGPTAIAAWANDKKDLLRRVLPLPGGVFQKDVYRRALSALKPAAFQSCFANWLKSLRGRIGGEVAEGQRPVFAVDGKTARRSHDRRNGLGPLHAVSVWASDRGLTLGQVATEGKSKEITAIPELLRLVDVGGAIITVDAMGT